MKAKPVIKNPLRLNGKLVQVVVCGCGKLHAIWLDKRSRAKCDCGVWLVVEEK